MDEPATTTPDSDGPKWTAVAPARSLPVIVSVPPLLSGPWTLLSPVTAGQPGPPPIVCRSASRVAPTGDPHPVAMS